LADSAKKAGLTGLADDFDLSASYTKEEHPESFFKSEMRKERKTKREIYAKEDLSRKYAYNKKEGAE
jgi:hypothetical protein